MPEHRLPRRAKLTGVGDGWMKAPRDKSRICCHRVQNKKFNVMKKQTIKSTLKTTRTVLKQSEHRQVSPPSTSVISQNSQSTGLVYDERMLKHKHEWFIEEQESPRRIQQAFHRCVEENLVSRCIRVPAIPINEDDLTLVHDKWYIEKIKQSCHMSNRELYSLSGEYDGVFFNRKARLAFANLRHLWRRRDIRLSTEGRVYCATVRSVLIYGSESWPVRVEDIRRLLVFDHRCLRNIARISWDHRVSNAVVKKQVLGEDGKSIDEVDPGAHVWYRFPILLGGLTVSADLVKAPDIRFSSSRFCKQQ
ncbi:unnamed protein product [Schistosoma mattheei]|uniref:Uncharacterized protein n=1 Tax=Schistosoma mattheei TaxID=31246 RepID=A0A183P036_9TREM|nr:unnamed protein product [Schistosoma mattheei]